MRVARNVAGVPSQANESRRPRGAHGHAQERTGTKCLQRGLIEHLNLQPGRLAHRLGYLGELHRAKVVGRCVDQSPRQVHRLADDPPGVERCRVSARRNDQDFLQRRIGIVTLVLGLFVTAVHATLRCGTHQVTIR